MMLNKLKGKVLIPKNKYVDGKQPRSKKPSSRLIKSPGIVGDIREHREKETQIRICYENA